MGQAINREGWLTLAVAPICKILASVGRNVDPGTVVVSVGWKSRGAMNANKLHCAEAWNGDGTMKRGSGLGGAKSADGKINVFVDPRIGEGPEALGALCHALCHVAVGFEEFSDGRVYTHGPQFKAVSEAIGLTKGKLVDAMPENKLGVALSAIADELGEYPHGAIEVPEKKRPKDRRKLWACPACEIVIPLPDKITGEDGPGAPYCACKKVPGQLMQFKPVSKKAKEKAKADADAKSAVLPETNGKPVLVEV